MANEATRIILAEYIAEDHVALDHILAYHKSFLEYERIKKTASAEKLGISRGTMYKILKGDHRVTVYSLRTFLNSLASSNCPVPEFHSMYIGKCSICPKHRFIEIICDALKKEFGTLINN